MIPSVGRIVHYKLREDNVVAIKRRRADARAFSIAQDKTGAIVHVGNPTTAGDVFPMIITRLWTDHPDEDSVVQGQVLLDGNDNLWVTSVKQGTEPGQWFEPPRVAAP